MDEKINVVYDVWKLVNLTAGCNCNVYIGIHHLVANSLIKHRFEDEQETR